MHESRLDVAFGRSRKSVCAPAFASTLSRPSRRLAFVGAEPALASQLIHDWSIAGSSYRQHRLQDQIAVVTIRSFGQKLSCYQARFSRISHQSTRMGCAPALTMKAAEGNAIGFWLDIRPQC